MVLPTDVGLCPCKFKGMTMDLEVGVFPVFAAGFVNPTIAGAGRTVVFRMGCVTDDVFGRVPVDGIAMVVLTA